MGIGDKTMSAGRPAVFLDRDGVLIATKVRDGKPRATTSLDDCEILPGVRETLLDLRQVGLPLVVITNQPDVATGVIERKTVDEIHKFLYRELPLDDILTCWHVDADQCKCRKPKPGMLFDAAERLQLNLTRSFMVGDRWRDIAAGRAAGCSTILIGDGYGEKFPVNPDHRAADLRQAAGLILTQVNQSGEWRHVVG
jgi:D-glycero-D-manno-heptose 1,7-bisphosphate phosphatase